MSTTSANDFSAHQIGFPGSAQNSVASAHQASANEDYYMSRSTRKIVYMFLLGGVVLLASVAAYVWYGFSQWQNLP
jgi:type VI protein secretion system component VasF